MDDRISRKAALDAIDGIKPMQGNMEQLAIKALCWAAVKTIQPVDAAPVVHGWWIYLDPRDCATISGRCSCCGWEAHYYEDDVADMPYCPNCGARMDGGSNG